MGGQDNQLINNGGEVGGIVVCAGDVTKKGSSQKKTKIVTTSKAALFRSPALIPLAAPVHCFIFLGIRFVGVMSLTRPKNPSGELNVFYSSVLM